MIIVGYQGIGKSSLAGRMGCVDLECGNFYVDGKRAEDWYVPYGNIALDLSRQGYCVMTPTHSCLRAYLQANCNGQRIWACYPSPALEGEWLAKLRGRYESAPSEKNLRALRNAEERYAANIGEIEADARRSGWGRIVLGRMDYNLFRLVAAAMAYNWEDCCPLIAREGPVLACPCAGEAQGAGKAKA